MAYEQQNNSGAVFVNDRKEKDTHPDRAGSATIEWRGILGEWVAEKIARRPAISQPGI
jgi:hypothetical protein